MILANNDFEQTLLLPDLVWELLGQAGAAGEAWVSLPESVRADLQQVGILDERGELTDEGSRMVGLVKSPASELSVCQLHAEQENVLRVSLGGEESIVRAAVIDDAGCATGEFIFSRTTHENALQHVLSWVSLPAVGMPEVRDASFSAEVLSARGFDESARGWRVNCSALPGGVHIFFREGWLWRLKGASEGSGSGSVWEVEAEDSLSLNLLLHYVWGRCVGELDQG